VTEHLRTVVWVVKQFLPVDVTITETGDNAAEITIRHA
jgi:RNA 3'-terminal phosphate cyclase